MEELKEEDFLEAAQILDCEVEAIKAVAKVESANKGFYDNIIDYNFNYITNNFCFVLFNKRMPIILYERHIFYNLLNKTKNKEEIEKAKKDSSIYNSLSGNYGSASALNQYSKLQKAVSINPEIGYQSASYGMFQIMGFNYKSCGFNDLVDFLVAMEAGQKEQLKAFCNFIKSNNLQKYLKNKQWAEFAKRYNGPNYKKNNYDVKMQNEYNKLKKEK